MTTVPSLRLRIANVLEVRGASTPVTWLVNGLLFALIAANLIAMVLESVASVRDAAPQAFVWFERVSLGIFAVEYVLRLWCCTALPGYEGAVRGRLRFAVTPMALVDLCAVLPLLVPLLGLDLRSARSLRLFRVFRVAKLARYTRSLRLFGRIFRERRADLLMSMMLLAMLLLMAASLMYFAENEAQPEVFSSIPTTLWWAVATLTTVGYGDLYPITALGRLLAGIICVLGIGMFALPTSILGAAFVRELGRPPRCPHCDRELHD